MSTTSDRATNFIDIRRSATTGGFVVVIDMKVTHHCADMAAVIELLKTLHASVTKADGDGKVGDGAR